VVVSTGVGVWGFNGKENLKGTKQRKLALPKSAGYRKNLKKLGF